MLSIVDERIEFYYEKLIKINDPKINVVNHMIIDKLKYVKDLID